MRIKVWKLAKDHGIESKALLEKLNACGIETKNVQCFVETDEVFEKKILSEAATPDVPQEFKDFFELAARGEETRLSAPASVSANTVIPQKQIIERQKHLDAERGLDPSEWHYWFGDPRRRELDAAAGNFVCLNAKNAWTTSPGGDPLWRKRQKLYEQEIALVVEKSRRQAELDSPRIQRDAAGTKVSEEMVVEAKGTKKDIMSAMQGAVPAGVQGALRESEKTDI